MKSLLSFTLALCSGVPVQAQQTSLPPGTQSPDAPSAASAPAASASSPGTTLAAPAIAPVLAAAEDKLEARDYDAARTAVLSYLQQHGNDARALFDLGYIEDATGQQADAEQQYRKAIAADPHQFEARAALGLLLAKTGKDEEARQQLRTAAELEPAAHDPAAKAQVWRTLAHLQVESDPAAAKASLVEALKLAPGESTPADLLLTAQIAEANDDPGTAETAYRKLLAVQPQDAAATAGLSHLLLQQKKAAEAEPLLRSALSRNPDDPALNSQLASVLATEGKMDDAVALLEKLHQLKPDDATVSRMLGDAYLQAGAADKAEPLFAAAIKTAPDDVNLLNDEGQSLILGKRFAEAVRVFTRASELDPTSADAWSGLAFASAQTHQDSITLKSLLMRRKFAEDTPATLFLCATAYDNLHQSQLAAEYYHKFLESANGQFPEEEWQAQHRLIALGRAH